MWYISYSTSIGVISVGAHVKRKFHAPTITNVFIENAYRENWISSFLWALYRHWFFYCSASEWGKCGKDTGNEKKWVRQLALSVGEFDFEMFPLFIYFVSSLWVNDKWLWNFKCGRQTSIYFYYIYFSSNDSHATID